MGNRAWLFKLEMLLNSASIALQLQANIVDVIVPLHNHEIMVSTPPSRLNQKDLPK